MKKFEEPIVKVVKFKAMDVIATSGDTSAQGIVGLEGTTYQGNTWIQDK